MASVEDPAPPTRVGDPIGFSRTTRDGRRLHYELRVLQQPERARACGSGPKSSADRRPVDPPPVVQMKVFQGPTRENAEDITFGYNADFFLYASLQHYIDPQARGPAPSPGPPVLTGMPVSSMILLDRPAEAGYFIFSDLSVRHEGCYFLTFALMEEVKDERDKDVDEPMSGTDEITAPEEGSGRHYLFRTQVKTDPFNVFSAKKFPGLMESTALSRTVAEQGCRVRIRRDVRMRRREKGGKKDIVPREDDYAQRAKADAAAAANRDRSSSNDPNGYYGRQPDLQRRPSGMGNGYQPQQQRPFVPAPEPASSSRPPPYGNMASYPQTGRSIPSSPAYPSPPHVAPYPPRPSYGPYATAERTPPYHGPPAPNHPREPQESYQYRPEPTRTHPTLAPKIPATKPPMGPDRDSLPPIHSIQSGVPEPRRPSHHMPRLLPHPPGSRDVEKLTLPPIVASAYAPRMPSLPPTPSTPSIMRKRSADEANLTSADDYRLQNGRRQEEQPHDANYRTGPGPWHRSSVPSRASVPEGRVISVHEERQQPPVDWTMSLDLYNRASDNDIPVDFPGLHPMLGGTPE